VSVPEPFAEPADRLTLTGLRAFGHHGVFEHERTDGQEFVIDLTIWFDARAAGSSDELGSTVHYGELAERVVAAVESDPVDLIETVAERVAAIALGYPVVEQARVTIHKPSAPITVRFADVSITITRTRG
jgi:dihydroneopterin aldolase